MVNIIRKALNIIILILVAVGVVVMFNSKASATGLTDTGWANFKFYTVLSNVFAGIIALCQLIADITGRRYLKILKLTAATGVALTFLVIAAFFGPLYGWIKLYQGSNLYFHLIVPILCIIEFALSDGDKEVTVRHCAVASLFTLAYGLAYLINIMINGVGTWPESNDWYGFLNWGMGIGIVIFAGIVAASFGIACFLRFIHIRRYNK